MPFGFQGHQHLFEIYGPFFVLLAFAQTHFHLATVETRSLMHIEPKSEFIGTDKDKVRKQSSSGKHQRGGFVLIIYIIFCVAIGKRKR